MTTTKNPMTVEEMEKRWSLFPPYDCTAIRVMSDGSSGIAMEVNQDTIDEIIEYFKACKESMNE